MIYLIGGGARCGKSTLAKNLLRHLPNATYLSGDSFRQSLKPILPVFHTSGVDADDAAAYIQYYKENIELAIDETIKRAEALWPFIERYIISYGYETDDDLIVESVDIWPHLIQQLAVPHKAVFLVDTDATQWQRGTAHLGKNDWMAAQHLSPEQIEAWAFYNAPRGDRILESAAKYGYKSYDIAQLGFEVVQETALLDLMNKDSDNI